jgi:L-ribulose-5-phosphate 3-epimerase
MAEGAMIPHFVGEVLVGLYEKALPAEWPWEQRLLAAAEAGYRYVEVSIDETAQRLARLEDAAGQRDLRRAVENTDLPVLTLCLSAHRKFALGSADEATRSRGGDIMRRAIDFAVNVGVRIVQVSGYDAFYEPHTAQTVDRYIEALRRSAEWAGQAGVMLALENVDVPLTESLAGSLDILLRVDSPWFQLYPDMANLAAAGYDPSRELELAAGHVVAVHVKDAQPGVLRGVPFGSGIVRFDEVFRALRRTGFRGPMTVEMWEQYDPDPAGAARKARQFVQDLLTRCYEQP